MGLLDVVNGVLNGPRGQSQPQTAAKGGMSPMTMAILGVLAFKALKGSGVLGGAQSAARSEDHEAPGLVPSAGAPGGGLSDILGGLLGGGGSTSGGLGGLLGGAAAGGALSGGLSNLLKDFQNAGHGQAAQSWVGTGPNQPIAPNDLAAALGADTLDALTKQTGMTRSDLLAGLSQHLPGVVDQLTPHGRLPSGNEAAELLENAPAR
ncbi:MAG TPA: YidB family protein [Xanthobacteraceae bacterium]|jgi:uncharacterized protein YidB (DUF937 family)|nr:YidB family protein [Xanthobacteraceae bacterium]